MAVTIAGTTPKGDFTVANWKFKTRTVTFDSSYPTGGEPIAPSDVGLKRIHMVFGAVAKTSDGANAVPVVYDYTNQKLQLYRYDGASAGKANLEEAANTYDASAYSARLIFVGQ